jgi:hypothetical protein
MMVTGPPARIPTKSVAAIPAQVLHMLKPAATISLAWRVLGGAFPKMARKMKVSYRCLEAQVRTKGFRDID